MNYIAEEVSSWASLYFVLFYTIMQMIVLNVISAVMVEVKNAISTDEAAVGECGTIIEVLKAFRMGSGVKTFVWAPPRS